MTNTFYMLEVATVKPAGESFAERMAACSETKRRNKAMGAYLKATGRKYLKRSNAFETREEAEQMILQMGFPYAVNVCEASWAF